MKNFSVTSTKSQPAQRRSGFTLVELLVVIAISSIVLSITLGGYRSFATGNQRTSCQTNLTQIYGALRLYVNDYDGYAPLFEQTSTPPDLNSHNHLGLWSLYVMQSNTSVHVPAELGEELPGGANKPIGVYLRNHKQLHCPADVDHEDRFLPNSNQFDMTYFSYQTVDDMGDTDNTNDQWTYLPYRGLSGSGTCPTLDPSANPPTTPADRMLCRQLVRYDAGNRLQRTPDDTTVVTWCKWHRGSRAVDNVLFYDGVVRPIPQLQPDTPRLNNPAGTGDLIGWQRVPS